MYVSAETVKYVNYFVSNTMRVRNYVSTCRLFRYPKSELKFRRVLTRLVAGTSRQGEYSNEIREGCGKNC